MREIRLNGKQYPITGEITKRSISPWKASVESGRREYKDFGQASLEEYFDFRNGIGKKRGLGTEARLDFSEGIDFTIEGQTVLGSLVTTAGTFGVAPVKIIDFDGSGSNKTYAIGHNQISEWSGSSWTSRDTSLANPLDAIVVQDDTDKYLIVSSATAAVYTTDGTTWTPFYEDFTTYTEVDTSNKLTVTATKALGENVDTDVDVYLYKDKGADHFDDINIDFEIYATDTSVNNGFGGMGVSNTVNDITGFAATDIAVMLRYQGDLTLCRGNFVATDVYFGATNTLYYCTLSRAAGADSVYLYIYSDANRATLLDTLTVAGFNEAGEDTTKYRYVYGFLNINDASGGDDWYGYVQNMALNEQRGYLADYANKLYSIRTDGSKVVYSVAKDIDTYSGNFTLTGNYGTVYDLFEGKLLADGTPVLYFCGTEGLYTIDVTNQIAYKQEVEYPPLTQSGRKGLYWNANVWVATGYGILKVTPSLATYIGPDQDDGLPSDKQGSIFDMVTVNNWLVYCVNGGGGTETLRPNVAGDETNIEIQYPDSTSHWDKVDEVSADEGGTYVRNTTAAWQRDLYNITNHSASGIINKITLYFRVNSYGTGNSVKGVLKSNGTVTETAEKDSGVDFGTNIWGTYSQEWALNPADSEAWEWSDIDLLQIGVSLYQRGGATMCTQVYIEVDYISGFGENKSSILKRSASIGGSLQVYTSATNKPIACLHHSPSSLYTNGRLWFGEDTDVKYMMFPDTTSNVKQISTYQYVDDSGFGNFPIFRRLAIIKKVALGVAAVTKSCDSDDYIEVFYGLNGAAPTTSLGTFKSSPLPTKLTFNSGLGTEFQTIQLAIKLFRGSTNTNSPELESLLFYWYGTPVRISAWVINIEAIGSKAAEIFTDFEGILDTNLLVPFYPSGATTPSNPAKGRFNVKLTQMPSREWFEEMGGKEGVFQIVLEQVFEG